MDFGVNLGVSLVGFWVQLDLQNRQKLTKIDVKMHLIWDIVFGFVLGVILVPTWTQPDRKIVDFSLCFVTTSVSWHPFQASFGRPHGFIFDVTIDPNLLQDGFQEPYKN